VLLPDGRSDDLLGEILTAGDVDMEFDAPDHKRWSLALLKSVYLALCIKFGVIEGPWADQVRADLIAARDARESRRRSASEIAQRLHVLRGFGPEPISTDPIVACIMRGRDGPLEGVLLAGCPFVSWSPTNDESAALPAGSGRRARAIHVGAPIESAVTAFTPQCRVQAD
jgi:hypothetical protein